MRIDLIVSKYMDHFLCKNRETNESFYVKNFPYAIYFIAM